jgi:tyrosine decarboxylase / aspartate 1-decarboxylase
MSWKKLGKEEINHRVLNALQKNVNYVDEVILGVPASHLDEKVFPRGASFLNDAPFLRTMVDNPNHIGCHTFGVSEGFFGGTQAIERELIEICSADILKAEPNSCDGYIASGGTEANMQAIWIYRNFFREEFQAQLDEICILCSADSHYSMPKAADILNLTIRTAAVDQITRSILPETLESTLDEAIKDGKKYFIVIANMMTTMFGSVDDPNIYIQALKRRNLQFKLHIDGAYGGFYYPFSNANNRLNFSNPEISSVTLDAHKMAQAPYGTGIFLARKGLMEYARTKEASYVEGEDCTIIGSRSGANAVAVWMILSTYGPHSWYEKIFVLQQRTTWLCDQLDQLKIRYYRNSFSNIVTMDARDIPVRIAEKYHLVPDQHSNPNWFKIVVMGHVLIEKLEAFTQELGNLLTPS